MLKNQTISLCVVFETCTFMFGGSARRRRNEFTHVDHYNNIDDVAALCASLDCVISTNITVPIISGGVGTLTKVANYRQSSCNNILLNPINLSVNIYEKNMWEPWDNVFNLIAEDIFNLKKFK